MNPLIQIFIINEFVLNAVSNQLPLLMYSYGYKMNSSLLESNNTIKLHNITLFNENDGYLAMDYSIRENLFFYKSSKINKNIKVMPIGSKFTNEKIFTSGSPLSNGLAIDWIHNLIYFNHGFDIHVMNIFNKRMRTIFAYNQTFFDIVVNPLESFIVYSKVGQNAAIIKASQDGSNFKVLVDLRHSDFHSGLFIVIDFKTKTIYFMDHKLLQLSSIDFDGNNRKLVHQIKTEKRYFYFKSFDFYDGNLYLYNPGSNELMKIDTNGLIRDKTKIEGDIHFMNIKIVHSSRQPNGENKCINSNCSYLCLPNEYNFKCVCPSDQYLLPGEICHITNSTQLSYIVFTAKDESSLEIRIAKINNNINSVIESKTLYKPNSTEHDEIVDIYYDLNGNFLVYSHQYIINILVLDKGNNLKSKNELANRRYITAIACDWIYDYLYFADDDKIFISKLGEPNISYLISHITTDYYARSICLNPVDLFIIWSENNRNGNYIKGYIYKSRYDGSNKTLLVNNDIYNPIIAIEYTIKRIYWIDSEPHELLSIDYNGNDRKVIYSSYSAIKYNSRISIYNGFIYWSEFQSNIHKINTIGEEKSEFMLHENFAGAFKIIHPSHQPNASNLCANTYCTRLCLPIDFNTYRCLCPDIIVHDLNKNCEEYVGSINHTTNETETLLQKDPANPIFIIIISILLLLVIILISTIAVVYRKYSPKNKNLDSPEIDNQNKRISKHSNANVYEDVYYSEFASPECYDDVMEPNIYVQILDNTQ